MLAAVKNRDSFWSRYTERTICLHMLKVDRDAYDVRSPILPQFSITYKVFQKHQERFINLVLAALVEDDVTLEHDFVCEILTIDGLQHRLLQGVPARREGNRYYFSKEAFLASRPPMIRGIPNNQLTLGSSNTLS
jgi:hypothetical protein